MTRLDPVRRLAARAACTASALLAGCMNFIPAYERPAAPVAAVYAPELSPAGATGAVPAAAIEWQRYFADARLKRLIDIALVNNRDLRVAVLNIEQARAAYQVKRADELPSVGAGMTAQRQAGAGGNLVTSYAVGLQVTSFELDSTICEYSRPSFISLSSEYQLPKPRLPMPRLPMASSSGGSHRPFVKARGCESWPFTSRCWPRRRKATSPVVPRYATWTSAPCCRRFVCRCW